MARWVGLVKQNVMKEKGECLRQENEGLTKEIEQLHADKCLDLEELVYLQWLNACFSHKLRSYQPPPSKTVPRGLSKSLNPTFEKKVEQLILEYANTKGQHDDYFRLDNSSNAKANTSESKIFGKLVKQIRGKDSHREHG
ncbi:CHUP1 [Spatholobus suberectus]|nr:CHUP1 [Spatholobus suberectus]